MLDCFTSDPFVFEHLKIEPARRSIPEWWKSLPNELNLINMKSCRGLIDLYNTSFCLPFWTRLQLKVKTYNERSFDWRTTTTIKLEPHAPAQYSGFMHEHYELTKITSPWAVKSNQDISFFFADPLWNKTSLEDLTILPGMVSFYNQHELNVNVIFKYLESPREINLFAGDPFVHLVPQTEHKVTLKHHLVDDRTLKSFHLTGNLFFNEERGKFNFLNAKRAFLDRSREKEKKCPFSKNS